MLMDGRAQVHSVPQDGDHSTLLLVLNAYHDQVEFILPTAADGHEWGLLLDTTDPSMTGERYAIGSSYRLTGRSVLLLVLGTHKPAPIPDKARAVDRLEA